MIANVVDICECDFEVKLPSAREITSMYGKKIGFETYCKTCNKPLSQRDNDIFGWELRD